MANGLATEQSKEAGRVIMHLYSIFAGGTVAIIIIIIIIIIIMISAATAAQDDHYANCSRLFECGKSRVGFPFSGLDRPANCGLQGFSLTCSHERFTMIAISGLDHKIIWLHEASRTLKVVPMGTGDILCPTDRPRNITVDPALFDFMPDTQFVALYYRCPSPGGGVQLPASLGQLNCSGGGGGETGDYFLASEDLVEDSVRNWLGSCGNFVRIPADRTELGSVSPPMTVKRLSAAIYLGFRLRWTGDYDGACAGCVKSGGQCGFRETAGFSFACYCSDQAYAAECLGGNGASPPAGPSDKTEIRKRKNRGLLKILLPVVAFIITLPFAAVTLFYYFRNRGLKKTHNARNLAIILNPPGFSKLQQSKLSPFGGSRVESPPNLQAFTFSDIKAATNDFSDDNLLGSGGFGPVYKCVLPGGEEMAVKRLSKSSTQGLLEFTNEVSLTARLQHVNLVRVVGFCTEKDEKMLVYEYMPNRSLDIYLFDPVKKLSLDWNIRVGIIEGVTQGLLYLQEYSNFTIIHRDIKASNILLDDEMNPKISDFGMAKLFRKDLYEANTNKIVGTYGYVPPEYAKKGIYSMKYDVYSFGVLLLEIISSKRAQSYYGSDEDMHILDHAYDLWRRGEGMEFFDPLLDDSSSQCKLMTCLLVALLCVQEKPDDRPTMLKVSSILRNGPHGMAAPKRPAYSLTREALYSATSSRLQREIFTYNNADISQVMPR